jgi:NitT/TauT family transport system substrate-binding protein
MGAMKRRQLLGAMLFALAIPLSAGGAAETGLAQAEDLAVRIAMPAGIPVAAFSKIMADDRRVQPGYSEEYQIIASSDLVAATLLSGDADLALVPSNLAASLYARGENVTVLGSVIHGVLYLITSDPDLELQGLAGREVAMLGRGLTPDILARYLFQESGIDPDRDLDLRYVNAAADLAPLFISGQADVAVVPEPMLTTIMGKRPDARILADFQAVWRGRFGGDYPQAALVALGGFEGDHPDYARAYTDRLAEALIWVNANPEDAGRLAGGFSEQLVPAVVAAAIPRSNLRFVSAAETRGEMDRYLEVLYEFDPGTVGGSLPDDGFYLR